MNAAPTSPSQAYPPELARRFGIIVATLRTGLGHAWKPHLNPIGIPLLNRLSRILRRFTDLMDRLAAGRPPRTRRGPHTGGAPHPENLQRGNPLPTTDAWLLIALGDLAYWAAGPGEQLERLLAEPAAAEILATVPAAERILRPLRRMLGLGPFNPNRRRARPARARKPRPKPARTPPPSRPYKCRLRRERTNPSRGYAWYDLFHPPQKPP